MHRTRLFYMDLAENASEGKLFLAIVFSWKSSGGSISNAFKKSSEIRPKRAYDIHVFSFKSIAVKISQRKQGLAQKPMVFYTHG